MLGNRIRERRRLLGMTQEELAGEEYTKSYISQIELGQTTPSLQALGVLAKRLGVCPGYLLTEECPLDKSALALDVVAREIASAAERIEKSLQNIANTQESGSNLGVRRPPDNQ